MVEKAEQALDHIAESKVAKYGAAFVVPLLLGLVAWLGSRQLTAIEESNRDLASAIKLHSAELQQVAVDLKLLGSKVDYAVIERVDSMATRIGMLEQRMIRLEDRREGEK